MTAANEMGFIHVYLQRRFELVLKQNLNFAATVTQLSFLNIIYTIPYINQVTCVGQVIGAVAADSAELARRAVSEVQVTYADLEPVIITIEVRACPSIITKLYPQENYFLSNALN